MNDYPGWFLFACRALGWGLVGAALGALLPSGVVAICPAVVALVLVAHRGRDPADALGASSADFLVRQANWPVLCTALVVGGAGSFLVLGVVAARGGAANPGVAALGGVCFLLGAALTTPAGRQALRPPTPFVYGGCLIFVPWMLIWATMVVGIALLGGVSGVATAGFWMLLHNISDSAAVIDATAGAAFGILLSGAVGWRPARAERLPDQHHGQTA